MRLDVESLRAFRLIAENNSVTGAAGRLNLSQSAVSHKIKRLEQRVGRALFARADGKLALTEQGEQLDFYARRILALHDEAVANLGSSEVRGTVRLGATEHIALSGLSPLLNRFAQRHPHATLRVKVEQSRVLQGWLRQGEIDIGLLQLDLDDVRPGDLQLWQDELAWISAPDREWDREASLPLVTFGPNCFYYPHITRALRACGQAHHVVLECPTYSGVFNAVEAGLGVSVINRRSVPGGLCELSPQRLGALAPVAYVARCAKGADGEALDSLLEQLPTLAR